MRVPSRYGATVITPSPAVPTPQIHGHDMRRIKYAKIVATLGPASGDLQTIRALFNAGADVFRLNFSHGTREEHKQRLDLIREVEAESGRSIGVLLDLQGPKLRIGTFLEGPVTLVDDERFPLDLDLNTPRITVATRHQTSPAPRQLAVRLCGQRSSAGTRVVEPAFAVH